MSTDIVKKEKSLQEIVFDLWDNAQYLGACVDSTDGSALYRLGNDFFIIWYYDHYQIKDVQKVSIEAARKCFPDVAI